MTLKIEGILFDKLIKSGFANLCLSEDKINDLNVFPVADGDTGSNMRLTLNNGIENVDNETDLGLYLKTLAGGMLLGARGNSGVILSQIFKGIALGLENVKEANALDIKNAFISGYKTAYDAVVKPVEGTILTVAREGVENISQTIDENTTIEELFTAYLSEMNKSLERTPELLSVLKEYGVVDSGAVGFITIIDGMYKALTGEKIEGAEPVERVKAVNISEEIFNENSSFVEGYCTEFILQLMAADKYRQDFSIDEYISRLEELGNSIVATKEGNRVKVHIHTLTPSEVIAYSQSFGEFLTFKLENMQIQHNEFVTKHPKKKTHRDMGVVAVVNGSGMKDIYNDFGCAVVIDGSSKMNTSTQEFLDAYREANSDIVVVLPNNKNNIPAAEQAASMMPELDIRIIPTASMVEGYFAMSMDIPDDPVEKRINSMTRGANGVSTIAETVASKDFENENASCKAGDEIALIGSEVVCAGENKLEVLLESIEKLPEIEDKEFCVIFRGEDVDEEATEELEELLYEKYPMIELQFMDGGQSIYSWLLGLI